MDLSRRSLLSAGLVLGATTLTGLSGPLQGGTGGACAAGGPLPAGGGERRPVAVRLRALDPAGPAPAWRRTDSGVCRTGRSTCTGRSRPTPRCSTSSGTGPQSLVRRMLTRSTSSSAASARVGSTGTASALRVTCPGSAEPGRLPPSTRTRRRSSSSSRRARSSRTATSRHTGRSPPSTPTWCCTSATTSTSTAPTGTTRSRPSALTPGPTRTPWRTTGSGTRSTRPTAISRPRRLRRRGW